MTEDKQIFSMEIEESIRQECAACKLRVDPSADVAVMWNELKNRGVVLQIGEHGLEVQNSAAGISARDALISASRDEALKANFVTPGSKLRHTSELSSDPFERAKQAVAYVREHGEKAWMDLCAASRKPALDPTVIISPSMSRDAYNNLTTKERVRFVASLGSDAPQIIARILNRKASK